MNENQKIGTRLREYRERVGMTQAELADRVDVSRQTINYIETGTFCPSTYLALRIAREFSLPVEDLFYLIEEDDEQRAV
ncbi:helix-turn-helix transcriptional regulator [bacterium]|nr:helix-turn-helix transcriptional regulator [bacterium]